MIPSGPEVLAGAAMIPLIIGLVQLCKNTFLKSYADWAPWIALALGELFSVGYALANGVAGSADLFQAVLTGLVFGLTASGLYSGAGPQVVAAAKSIAGKN